ncbi:MAG TPA: DUF1501 domain-containing protein [Pirellulales bacterium]|jgi:uncharacterized protein (DUF1501 family)|nr:DUF1501 domain-containing protein [Pirellulales bacterium]
MEMLTGGCASGSDNAGGNRRQFLKNGAVTLGGLALPQFLSRPAMAAFQTVQQRGPKPLVRLTPGVKSVVYVVLPGGPSQLDMYDMKPAAPAEIRGEFRAISTNVPGMRVCEHLPLHAKIADKFAIVNGVEMADRHDPSVMNSNAAAPAGCRIEVLVRSTETMATEAEDEPAPRRIEIKSSQTIALPHGNWDTHGRVLGRSLTIFQELREKLPAYDRLLYDFITDVYQRGLDKDVLIIAHGEFGRTPWLNEHGGRNHWATSGSVLFAGGGLKTGQVVGDTGPIGERERSRSQPYRAGNVLAMMFRHFQFNPATLPPTVEPIAELI